MKIGGIFAILIFGLLPIAMLLWSLGVSIEALGLLLVIAFFIMLFTMNKEKLD